jgi:hypothetical protein
MARDLKYLSLDVGFLAAMLVFNMAAATGAIIIAPPALAQTDGDGGNVSTTITDAQIRLAQAMTALQNKNTTGAMMQLKLLNQSLSTLSTGVGGMVTAGVSPGPGPSTVSPGPGPSTVSPGPGPSTVSPGPGPSTVSPGPGPSTVSPGISGGSGPGAGSSGPGISGGSGPGAGSSGPGISGGGGPGAGR